MGIFNDIFGSPKPAILTPEFRTPMAHQPRVVETKGESQRSFEAGVTDRLTSQWTVRELTINQDLYRNLKVMRARSREFCQNVELGKKYINILKTNICGPTGFALSVDARNPDGTLDRLDAIALENSFNRWAKRGICDVTGKHSFVELQHIIMASVARDGEVLVRKVKGSDRGPFKFQLQILPAYLLDENHNIDIGNGRKIRLGIEIDQFDKPVAYHIRDGSQDVTGAGLTQSYTRVPADEIYHLFVSDEASQYRGYPWAAAALRRARHLDQFEESAIVAAHVGASKSGFFTKPAGVDDPSEISDDEVDDEFISDAVAGSYQVLPDGYDFKEFNPAYPSEIYANFTRTVARSIATGLGVSYHTLSGDLENVNYSSIRAGTIDERDFFTTIQGWLIESFLKPLYSDWLPLALANDPKLTLPVFKIEKYDAPVWSGRRWQWIDPQSEMTAAEKAVALGVKSRADIIRESGRDPERVFSEIDAENARLGIPKAPDVPPAVK